MMKGGTIMKAQIANHHKVKKANRSGPFSIMRREIVKDKMALASLILLGLLILIVYGKSDRSHVVL